MSVSNLYFSGSEKRSGCKILLVRHPESDSNRLLHCNPHTDEKLLLEFSDPGPTALGMEQVKCTANYLAKVCLLNDSGERFKRVLVVSAIQNRALVLAKSFMEETKNYDSESSVTFRKDYTLYEYRRVGKGSITIDGFSLDEEPIWDVFAKRVTEWKFKLENEANNYDLIILFGHSIFFSTLLHLCSGSVPTSVDEISFHFPNASISHLVYNGERWSILYHGNIAHLPVHLRTGTHSPIYPS